MSKKKIIIVFVIILIACVGWMGFSSIKKVSENTEINDLQANLSELLNHLESEEKVASGSIVVYFNSECQSCRWELKEISKKIDQLRDFQLILVSFEPEKQARTFLEKHNLEEYYLDAKPSLVIESFTGVVPQTLIYNGGLRIKHFKGETSLQAILSAFE